MNKKLRVADRLSSAAGRNDEALNVGLARGIAQDIDPKAVKELFRLVSTASKAKQHEN